jgi:hypothetical protein
MQQELLDFLGAVNDLMDDDGINFDMFSAADSPWGSPTAAASKRSARSSNSARSRRGANRTSSSSRAAGASSRRRQRGRSREDEDVVEVPLSAFTGRFSGSTGDFFGDLEELLEVIDLEDVVWTEEDIEAAAFREGSRHFHVQGGVFPGEPDIFIIH